MKDIMLDLETLGNGKSAAICQIGACYFDRHTGAIGETFKVNVDVASSVRAGAKLDAETVYWWLSQSDEARASILADPKVTLEQALILFNEFSSKSKEIWSHATFDFVTIMDSYKLCNINPTFSFRSARDIRTLVDLARVTTKKTERTGLHHDALEDCKHQVKYCTEAFNKLNKLKKLSPLLKEFINE